MKKYLVQENGKHSVVTFKGTQPPESYLEVPEEIDPKDYQFLQVVDGVISVDTEAKSAWLLEQIENGV